MAAPEDRPPTSPTPRRGGDTNSGGARRAGRGGSRHRKKGRGGVIVFLLVSAVPVAAVIWYLMQAQETKDKLIGMFDGSGGRAAKAGICLVVLIALARLALPAFHATSGALKGAMERIRARTGVARIALFPVEFVVWLLWFTVQILFAVDAILILGTCALVIILVIRIVDPTVLQDVLPAILS